MKEFSSNNIYLINQNQLLLIYLKLNKNLLIKNQKKSEIYIFQDWEINYMFRIPTNNRSTLWSKNKQGNSIKLEPLKNQENGQPQLIVPLSDSFIILTTL